MNLTTDSLHNPMKEEDIWLDLLTTKVIISPQRYSLLKHNRVTPELLLEVPTNFSQPHAGPTKRGESTTRSNI